ncbi:MAG: hypothetical protein V1717_02495, partial [Candidatus Micrarchaeota archaeon]
MEFALGSEEELLKQKLGPAKLEERISALQKRFSGLLTREGALKLMAHDEGLAFKKKPLVLKKLADAVLQEQTSVSVIVRVKQVFCAREFEREGRTGRVCNVLVGDETGEAKLVLWNDDVDFAERKLERNSCIKAENVLVKNGELQSNLFSEIALESPPLGLPDFSKPVKKLSQVEEGDDFFARVVAKGKLTEFDRNGEKRLVLNLTVGDDETQKTLVCWNRNARLAGFLKEGDVLKAEGISVKNGELHASWQTHLILHAKNHSLKELEFKPFAQLQENETAFVQFKLDKLFEARVSRKCGSCASQVPPDSEKCGCGGVANEVFFVTAQVSDSSSSARCVFFGEQARELLGLKKTLVSPQTIFALEREFL